MTTNATSSDFPTYNWKAEPDFRGTSSILSACVSTLAFCVWSAIHVDIPKNRESRSIVGKLGWLSVGMLVPELFVFIAYRQRDSASWLVGQAHRYLFVVTPRSASDQHPVLVRYPLVVWRKITSLFWVNPNVDNRESLTGEDYILSMFKNRAIPQRQHPWTLVHGFYASMGGFVIETVDENDVNSSPFLPESDSGTRAVLTPQGVAFVMERDPDLLPDLSEDSIMDHSKADGFAKLIQLGQAAWFCLHCITRLAQGLPTSLLEVSTLAHAVCTLATYLLWWNKPLNIGEPSIISGERARELCALLKMSGISRTYIMGGAICLSYAEETRFLAIAEESSAHRPTVHVSAPDILSPPDNSALTRLPYGVCLPGTRLFPTLVQVPPNDAQWTYMRSKRRMNLIFEGARPWYTRIDNHLEPFLQRRDITRWRLASRALARYNLSSFPSTWAFAYVVPHAELQSSTDPKGAGYGDITRMSCAAALLGAMYGAPHFIPWNTNDFPTAIEKLLWRAATVIVAASGTYFGAMFVVSSLVFRLAWPRQQGANRGWTSWLPRRDKVEAALIVSGALVYCGAGAFLVTESFRQLFYLPPGAYKLPSWSNYFPHFT